MASPTGSPGTDDRWSTTGPPVPILAASFLLAGLGTVVLGPLLPQLLLEWQLSDQRGGLLLLAKFVGAFLGGASVPRRLRVSLLSGHFLAALGFVLFARSGALNAALPALLLTGFGLGQMIASTNILAGRRWPAHSGSALALLNFFFSLGAVSTGLLVAGLLPRLGWRTPSLGLAALLAFVGLLGLMAGPHTSAQASPAKHAPDSLRLRIAGTYGGLLFLYGGLETCLTAWLTTFSLRFAGGHLLGGQSGFVVLWAALTAGRIVASGLMQRFSERIVQRFSLALCLLLIAVLATTHSAASLSVTCILLGLALAPVFPSTFALLLQHEVQPRVAGTLLAVSGLGAALFPWLMGVVSTRAGSLRVAMTVPALLIPGMLLLTLAEVPKRNWISTLTRGKGEDSVNSAL